jgi:hypothetical protein
LIEPQHTLPFGCVSEGYQGIVDVRQWATVIITIVGFGSQQPFGPPDIYRDKPGWFGALSPNGDLYRSGAQVLTVVG